MKTLEKNGYVQRFRTTNKDQFKLTDEGKNLAEEIFTNSQKPQNQEEIRDSAAAPRNCSMLVSTSDIECRTTLDVIDAINRTNRQWKKSSIPVVSIWFLRNNEVYDTIVQFSGGKLQSTNNQILKHTSGTPFKHKIVIVTSKENVTCVSKKLQAMSDFGISLIYIDTSAQVANYLDKLCYIMDKRGTIMGSLKDVTALCETNKFAPTVGEVWQKTLKLFPGCGPQLSAAIYSIFKTPIQLIDYFNKAIRLQSEDKVSVTERFCDLIQHKTGLRPKSNTVDALMNVIGVPIEK